MSTNRRIDPAIIAALIGVMGTVCVTVITLLANNFVSRPPSQATDPVQPPTWTVPPPSTDTNTPAPTDTVPPGDPTSTPVPDTQTPEPTFTPVPPAIGADWVNNCISVLWRPYPDMVLPTAGNGCYAGQINFPEPVNTLYTEDLSLKFLVNRSFVPIFVLKWWLLNIQLLPRNIPAIGKVNEYFVVLQYAKPSGNGRLFCFYTNHKISYLITIKKQSKNESSCSWRNRFSW